MHRHKRIKVKVLKKCTRVLNWEDCNYTTIHKNLHHLLHHYSSGFLCASFLWLIQIRLWVVGSRVSPRGSPCNNWHNHGGSRVGPFPTRRRWRCSERPGPRAAHSQSHHQWVPAGAFISQPPASSTSTTVSCGGRGRQWGHAETRRRYCVLKLILKR